MRKYLFLFLLSANAFSSEISCPPELKTDQKSVDAPKDWKVYEEKFNSRHMLSGVDFYQGHPDEGNRLAPKENVWSFEKKDLITIVCRYNSTLLTLTQEVKNKESCEVNFDKNQKPKKIACR